MKLKEARRVIAAAEKKAYEVGQPMNIAGRRRREPLRARAHGRGLDRKLDISIKKAFTSRAFDIATKAKDLATQSQRGKQFVGIHASNDTGGS